MPIFGLINLGNTCYMNSILQCLKHNEDFNRYLISQKYDNYNERINKRKKNEINLLNSYANIIRKSFKIKENEKVVFKLTAFVNKFSNLFNEVALNPNDAHEALLFLLNNFHDTLSRTVKMENVTKIPKESIENWKKFYNKDYSEIINLYFGQYQTQVKCLKCNDISITYTPFCDLQVDFTNSLENSIDKLFELEDVEITCDKCKNKKKSKQNTISMLPDHLIISIKRFSYINGLTKKNGQINVKLMLNLTKYYTFKNRYGIYNLYAGILHLGSAHNGHYIAFGKSNDKWYEYNDSNVNEINIDKLKYLIDNAYILFYKKC